MIGEGAAYVNFKAKGKLVIETELMWKDPFFIHMGAKQENVLAKNPLTKGRVLLTNSTHM